MPAPASIAVSNTIVWLDTLRPRVPRPATTPWAVASETPMVINGSSMVSGLRYTISRIASRPTMVAVSMRTRSCSPMSWMSLKVPAGPVVKALSEVPAVASFTVCMARLVASMALGVAISPTMLTGSSQALPSLLASTSFSGGTLMKSCSAATSSGSARSLAIRFL